MPVTNKPNTKEVQCQLATVDESNDMRQSDLLYTPRSYVVFSAEDLLFRAQGNNKINNILRSPTKYDGSVRQRSVYTNSNLSPQPSHYMQHSTGALTSRMSNLSLNSSNTSVGTSTGVPVKESSSSSNICGSSSTYRPQLSRCQSSSVLQTSKSLGTRYGGHFSYENGAAVAGAGAAPGAAPPYLPKSHHTSQFPMPMSPPPHSLGRVSSRSFDFENPPVMPPPCPGSGPIAMSNGTIQIRLREGVRIDMTLDKAIRVLNQRSMVAVAMSRNGTNSALIHPNGRILQIGSKVEIVAYDGMRTNNYVRYAKMWNKGVSFTSDSCALIYLVDTAGTRTTTDTFTDLTKDHTLAVFYDDSRHGPCFLHDAQEVVAKSTYNYTDEGSEMYEINGFRIVQSADGLVKVTRHQNKGLIRTSPSNGSATLTTTNIHCTASLGKTSHLFLRRNEKRMHFDGKNFIVRNAGHSAGFNENNLLIVY